MGAASKGKQVLLRGSFVSQEEGSKLTPKPSVSVSLPPVPAAHSADLLKNKFPKQ